MEQINPHKAIQYIIDTAPLYAQAKAQRVYLEEARKSIKAKLMNSSPETVLGKQESYAYSHPDYLELLQGLRVAVEEEVKLHWLLQAAQARIEVFKTTQYTQRAEIKAMS
jgi:hypothetical protein